MIMTASEDEDENLASFLESEILSDQDQDQDQDQVQDEIEWGILNMNNNENKNKKARLRVDAQIESGIFSTIPAEIFHHILKFLSSEDLIACSLVCKFLTHAASDECLWHRLYSMRWGLDSPTIKLQLRECSWKQLYIKRDEEDLLQFAKNTHSDLKQYYIQMQVAKRSQAPLPSQVNDDSIILDKTVADQVSMWRVSRGLVDEVVSDHSCSGNTCSYFQIGNVFLCEKTGRVHVCGDTCREVFMDIFTGLWVCTVSGHCFDTVLANSDAEPDAEQQGGVTDDAEPFMGSGRFARAYLLGYGCDDEKELEDALRFC